MNNENNIKLEKERCINCHFFSKYFIVKDNNENFEYIIPTTNYDRDKAKKEDFEWQLKNFDNKHYKLRCYFHLWDEDVNDMKIFKKINEVNIVNRKDKCFFLEYNNKLKIGLPKAKDIQEKKVTEYQKKEYNGFIIIGLIIAILFLIVNMIFLNWKIRINL